MRSIFRSNSCRRIRIDNRIYQVEILRRVYLNNLATRIVIPTFIMNDIARDITRLCIESIRKFTTEDIEIWVVDNNSEKGYVNWLIQVDGVNLVLNRTEPINPAEKPDKVHEKLFGYKRGDQLQDVSYANAVGLELGRLCIDPSSHTIFTMHSDTLVTKSGWLSHLKSKLTERVRAAAFRKDPIRVHALHIGGLLLDFRLFEPLQMSFLPNMRQERYPNMPEYDVGDQITLKLREHGFETYVSPNTFNNPDLSKRIDLDSPFCLLSCDRCFDDAWDVFYMHLGRGAPKATGTYGQIIGKVYPAQWVEFAKEHLLS